MHNRKKSERYLKNSLDIVFLVLSFLSAVYLSKQHIGMEAGFFSLGTGEIFLLLFLCILWYLAAKMFGLYDEFRSRSFGFEFIAIAKSILMQIILLVAILFIIKTSILSRFFIVVFFVLFALLVISCKICLRTILVWLQKNGRNLFSVMIVGAGEVGLRFYDTITANSHLGYRVKGFVDEQPPADLENLYLGKIEQLEQIINRENIDEVIIALPNSAIKKIGQVIAVCENYPTRVRIIPDYFEFMSPRFEIARFGTFPLISIRANPLEQLHWRLLKRSCDLLFTLLLFIGVFSWLWPLLALLIKISSPGPVFFKQERWGIKNKRIVCYKFRSMVKESRDVDENGRYQQATSDDPRITRLGSFLRRNNLDELPQFINVLKGEMSVVGPRPHPTPMNLEIKDSVQHYQLRHLVKPGITGWAQVNGFRGETSDPDLLHKRVEFDIWYIENWSFLLDIKIAWLSLWLMLNGDIRAY
ncbi:MAG: undecaprenyl-phosphate glucose phosphotransferase [Candidatus Aminicenantes bacterium]|nr:undecaprenyl-phosphate glucose phosphotransferase [Acidobacteriota bacterium]MCG2811113.1 undecaprenyl-phosphate glucose phosphotransferase [Candidatus Aminicenantes bacterium]